jgi:predicted nucleotidyltransferase
VTICTPEELPIWISRWKRRDATEFEWTSAGWAFLSGLPYTEIVTKTDIVEALERHRLELKRFSVRSIALFGSYAKDAQTDSSDLDFVVEFSAPTYDHFVGLEQFLEQLFDRPVDILTPAGVNSIRVPQIVEDIKRTIVHVWTRTAGISGRHARGPLSASRPTPRRSRAISFSPIPRRKTLQFATSKSSARRWKHLPATLTGAYPKIEWKSIAGLRDKLVHDYFGVKVDILWGPVRPGARCLTGVQLHLELIEVDAKRLEEPDALGGLLVVRLFDEVAFICLAEFETDQL